MGSSSIPFVASIDAIRLLWLTSNREIAYPKAVGSPVSSQKTKFSLDSLDEYIEEETARDDLSCLSSPIRIGL